MNGKGNVLIVDDDRAMCDLLVDGLTRRGFDVRACTTAESALDAIRQTDYEALVTDLHMPRVDGIHLCSEALAIRPGLPVIVITAFGSLDTAISAIRAGAYDFITKPLELDVLSIALQRAVSFLRLKNDLRRLQDQAAQACTVPGLIGTSRPMRRVYDLMSRVAESELTALVTGESGTGKELVAKALHGASPRRGGPFVAVNCAAMPEQLLESELFGHVRGAFTDARAARSGLFLRANGGTLFLDEIGEMPLAMQAKLLRALQDRKLRPVGSDEEVEFDVRLVAATNRDLLAAVDEGRFRQDLYFRLNVLEIQLPPLRARGNDILLLAKDKLERTARTTGKPVKVISSDAATKLLTYNWPGNVRELHNYIERAVALARFDQITVDDLPDVVRNFRSSHVLVVAESAAELAPLEEVERRYILRVLEVVGGNRTSAARILGLDRKTLQRKVARWEKETTPGGAESE